tara:strand:+ start:190 stop:1983 length:1794 start_codon:yes stop_codon:yes gene_type:complete
LKIVKKILSILSSREKNRFILIVIFGIISSIFEVTGLISILPFIAVLTNPEIVQENYILNNIFIYSNIIGINTEKDFLILVGIFTFIIFTFSLILRAFLAYFSARFSAMCQFNVSKRVVSGYLNKPYSWFLDRNTSELGKNILSEVSIVISAGLMSLLNLIIYVILSIFILSLLIIIDPLVTIIISLVIGLFYLFFYKFFFSSLKNQSEKRFLSNKWRFKTISETFAALKEIKLLGIETILIERFSEPAKKMAKSQASLMAINKLPRFAIEALTFGGILIISILLVLTNKNFVSAMPIIALYAFAGYRLMPSFQTIYLSISLLRTVGPPLNALNKDISNLIEYKKKRKDYSTLDFKKQINLKDVSYQYSNDSKKVLDKINISIPIGTSVGLTGPTGSGKTTLVDIILGLIRTNHGDVIIDNEKILDNNIRAWQNCIGYVPQQIYLADDTIEANIAFGKDENEINHKRIIEVAKLADIHEFINSELPLKYQTNVGERGTRLSGGQRQRVGIARALYQNPKVIVFDEATSALDFETEKKIINSILNIRNKKTVIFITHKIEAIKEFDRIIVLDKGKIIESAKYPDLIRQSAYFKSQLDN